MAHGGASRRGLMEPLRDGGVLRVAAMEPLRDQDRLLPINNVGRVMREEVPPGFKVTKECKELMQEILTEFILFVTSEAAETSNNDRRRKLSGHAIVEALETLGFDPYLDQARATFAQLQEAAREEKEAKDRVRAERRREQGQVELD